MSFRFESEMLAPVERWLKGQGLRTKREFANPWGLCDVVGCSLRVDKVRERLSLGQRRPIGPPFRIQVLNQIPDQVTKRSISIGQLASHFSCFVRTEEIDCEVEKLVADKFVTVTAKGRLQRVNGWMPLHDRIVAVELKISRIEEVISQATANLQLTNFSYIALPTAVARRLIVNGSIGRVQKIGIGLLSVSKSRCEQLIAPRSTSDSINKEAQLHCVERFWRDALKDSSS